MLKEITYMGIFGKPLIFYLGIMTLISLLITASIPILNKTGVCAIAFKWHQRFAVVTIILALVHGTMGILSYL